jgi:AcrR family transcriptional regulator
LPNGDQTRERIERVALDLFLERGYAGTPLRLIAEAADLTTPALYWHYKSKGDLCFSIVAREFQEFGDLVRAAVGRGSPEEQLREYVEAFVSLQLRRRKGPMKLGFDQLVASLPPAQRTGIDRIQRPLFDGLRGILKSGQSLGVFAVLDVTVTSFAIISMADYVFTWYRPTGEFSIDEIAAEYADLAVRLARGPALGPEPSPRVSRAAAVPKSSAASKP